LLSGEKALVKGVKSLWTRRHLLVIVNFFKVLYSFYLLIYLFWIYNKYAGYEFKSLKDPKFQNFPQSSCVTFTQLIIILFHFLKIKMKTPNLTHCRPAMPFGNRKKIDYLLGSVFVTIQTISLSWKPDIYILGHFLKLNIECFNGKKNLSISLEAKFHSNYFGLLWVKEKPVYAP